MMKSTGQRRWHVKNVRPRLPDLTPLGRWRSAHRNCYADFRAWLKGAGYGESTLQQYCVGALGVWARGQSLLGHGSRDRLVASSRLDWGAYPQPEHPRAYRKGMVKLSEFVRTLTHRPAGPRELNWGHYLEGLPEWLGVAVKAYLAQRRRAWQPEEVHRKSVEFLSDHTRSLRWMAAHATLRHLADMNLPYGLPI